MENIRTDTHSLGEQTHRQTYKKTDALQTQDEQTNTENRRAIDTGGTDKHREQTRYR